MYKFIFLSAAEVITLKTVYLFNNKQTTKLNEVYFGFYYKVRFVLFLLILDKKIMY